MTAEVGTRIRSDARDNRARIVLAARLAFAAEGPGVPIREIARRAEVGVATVYRHFPSKEALFTEAFAEQTALCSAIVREGLAASDPWRGFRMVIEKLLAAHARDREFRAYVAQLPRTAAVTADRDRALRMLIELVRRAKEAGDLRPDIVVEDIVLAMMASDGIRADSPGLRVAASRRLAALMLESFRATPASAPLPPAVRLPLAAR
ncbi:TetR/AcrR family transcriptional regulator [Actinomadura bangladeshensis]|uniref:TetR/AcrR family transcriptional regulator n=1 Tax=Actinomadura bangladeshensis TaxID=453573 RepID=A0A4R4NHG2_9ACTN|nr:TetR/AcrR family transcriptional regulator [Actinomadura bangladeshensis]TDC06827.1 TetR/AcrR family transcriptional regulator [Actinomadura bangladeshensis]